MAVVQWFPGHMTKALRDMKQQLSLVDLVLEMADARMPLGSRNPELSDLCRGKDRILILNKSDLSDPEETRKWTEEFEKNGLPCVSCDGRSQKQKDRIKKLIEEARQKKDEKNRAKGILNRPLRICVVGIPNVGKSTLINSFSGQSAAKTGNRPGVTRGTQWIKWTRNVELMDTPGLLWPKIEDQETARKLALLGTIRSELLDYEELSSELIGLLIRDYPGALSGRYGVPEEKDVTEVLAGLSLSRGCLLKGGAPDLARGAKLVVEDFRSGRLGRFTLERIGREES